MVVINSAKCSKIARNLAETNLVQGVVSMSRQRWVRPLVRLPIYLGAGVTDDRNLTQVFNCFCSSFRAGEHKVISMEIKPRPLARGEGLRFLSALRYSVATNALESGKKIPVSVHMICDSLYFASSRGAQKGLS